MNNLLFNIPEETFSQIQGLRYLPDFITSDEEQVFIEAIDRQMWLTDMKRRVQHYGYRYDYKARSVAPSSYIGPLPNWIEVFCQRLKDERLFNKKPDQVIVNEYLPGQGISAHIDCVPCFGTMIASLSLGGGAVMQFAKDDQKQELYLEPRSLVFLSDSARYEWTHAIPARKSDYIDGYKRERARRVSLTFRNVLQPTAD